MLEDEQVYSKNMNFTQSSDSMLIDLRKYLIDKVFDYGDSTELRNVTLQ